MLPELEFNFFRRLVVEYPILKVQILWLVMRQSPFFPLWRTERRRTGKEKCYRN